MRQSRAVVLVVEVEPLMRMHAVGLAADAGASLAGPSGKHSELSAKPVANQSSLIAYIDVFLGLRHHCDGDGHGCSAVAAGRP